mmetsp:Transcript_408/g.1394  ORF Transcript_408/g.1394 Transcript_408/m.1394 type:complete len:317 (-) Transcript_408:9-959(-)
MTIWPFQQVVCFTSAPQQSFVAPRLSAAYALWCLNVVVLIFVPLFGVFASDNVWIKESSYREQPAVRFTHDLLVLTSGDNQSMGWTTRDSLQHLLPGTVKVPAVRASSIDNNHDGRADVINLDVRMPLDTADLGMRRVVLLATFICELRDRVRLSMMGLVALDLSSSYAASGVQVMGELNLKQTGPLRVYAELRDIYMSNPLDEQGTQGWEALVHPISMPDLLGRYVRRNETLQLNMVAPALWDYAPSDAFEIKLRLQVPAQEVLYVPGVLEILKFAWMQYAALLVPTWVLATCVMTFAFERQIVETSVVSSMPPR